MHFISSLGDHRSGGLGDTLPATHCSRRDLLHLALMVMCAGPWCCSPEGKPPSCSIPHGAQG